MDTEGTSRWQPMMVVLRGGGRLECLCGALAVVVVGTVNKEAEDKLEAVDYWCQACYLKQEEEG